MFYKAKTSPARAAVLALGGMILIGVSPLLAGHFGNGAAHSCAGCATGQCQPRTSTYGHHQATWRRWPGASNYEGYIRPRPQLSVPAEQVPDKINEGRLEPRSRSNKPLDSAPMSGGSAAPGVMPNVTPSSPADFGSGDAADNPFNTIVPESDIPAMPDTLPPNNTESIPTPGAEADQPNPFSQPDVTPAPGGNVFDGGPFDGGTGGGGANPLEGFNPGGNETPAPFSPGGNTTPPPFSPGGDTTPPPFSPGGNDAPAGESIDFGMLPAPMRPVSSGQLLESLTKRAPSLRLAEHTNTVPAILTNLFAGESDSKGTLRVASLTPVSSQPPVAKQAPVSVASTGAFSPNDLISADTPVTTTAVDQTPSQLDTIVAPQAPATLSEIIGSQVMPDLLAPANSHSSHTAIPQPSNEVEQPSPLDDHSSMTAPPCVEPVDEYVIIPSGNPLRKGRRVLRSTLIAEQAAEAARQLANEATANVDAPVYSAPGKIKTVSHQESMTPKTTATKLAPAKELTLQPLPTSTVAQLGPRSLAQSGRHSLRNSLRRNPLR